MSEQWYYVKGNQKHGPVTPAKLKEMAASEQLHPSDLIWKEGMKQWAKAGAVRGLFPNTSPAGPPPLPPQKGDEPPPQPTSSSGLPPQVNTAVDPASPKQKVPSSQTAIFHIRYPSYYFKFLQSEGEVRLEGTMLIFSGKLPSAMPFAKPKPLTIPIANIFNVTVIGTKIKLKYRKEGKVKKILFITQTKEDTKVIFAAITKLSIEELQQNKTNNTDEKDTEKSIRNFLNQKNSENIARGFILIVALVFIFGHPIRWCLDLVGHDGGVSETQMLDFADNPSSYKGKTLTMKLTYDGHGLAGWMENGIIEYDIHEPFFGQGFSPSYFKFDVKITLHKGMKVPPLRELEDALVTFEADGTLGGKAIKIVRP